MWCVVGVKVCILDLGPHSIYTQRKRMVPMCLQYAQGVVHSTPHEPLLRLLTACWPIYRVFLHLLAHPSWVGKAIVVGDWQWWLWCQPPVEASLCACVHACPMCMCMCAPYESSGVLWLCTVHTSLKFWGEEPVLPAVPGVTSTPTYLQVMRWSVHTLCIYITNFSDN